MDAVSRIENALNSALQRADGPSCPPKLIAAMQHSVFPKGARVRPRTIFAVGDPKQSIYGFQGADPERFLSEAQRLDTQASGLDAFAERVKTAKVGQTP